MDELQVVLAQRAVFVAGGVLCVLLAVQLIGKHRAIAERLERATTDLKWVIADARRAITEAREEAKHLTTAELSAIEQEQELEWHSGQGKLESARKSASDQQEEMTKRLNDMEGTVQRVLGDLSLLKPQAGAVWNSILAVLTLALAGFLFICASRVPPPILLAIF